MFADYLDVETDSAGLSADADVQLSAEQILWADIIFVMEAKHKKKLQHKFKRHLNGKRVIVLGIPDNYSFMQSELVKLLENKVAKFL
ncbi:MAG: protein tyrosine phosphatase [Robiginitomaculum sp.]|nr:protein tyrosine phosphatase [Robiginitomaculum sp.]